jgi:hypothetical protein
MGEQITLNAVGVEKYEKLRALVKSTNKEDPKPEHLAALRRFFDDEPEMWRGMGDMAKRTLNHLLRTYYQQSTYMQECTLRKIDEVREQLGCADGSPLERLLIDQIAVCYVNLYALEINSASKLRESHSTETGLYWDRRITGAQRRFGRACETLARIRKLSRNPTALQFNIAASGGQQVNLAK